MSIMKKAGGPLMELGRYDGRAVRRAGIGR
jgi:hypothetical protein